MMCERGAVALRRRDRVLAKKQMVQEYVADSWIELHQFRLMVLHAAWVIDQVGGAKARQGDRGGARCMTPKVLTDIVFRAMHVHGSLGVSNEMPLIGMWTMAPVMGIADGPTEVHKVTVARQMLKGYSAVPTASSPPRTCPSGSPRPRPASATSSTTSSPTRPSDYVRSPSFLARENRK